MADACKAFLAHALRQDGLCMAGEVRLDIGGERLCLPNVYPMNLVVEARTVERLVAVHPAHVNSYLRFSGWNWACPSSFEIGR